MTIGNTPLEWIAALASLAAVIYAVKASWLTWPTTIVGVAAYAALFWRVRLYADFGLQIAFMAQSAYGWHLWTKKGGERATAESGTRIRRATSREIRQCAAFLIVLAPALAYALGHLSDAAMPAADSLLTTLSLIATFLLARKVIENWIIWIIADVGYISLFLYKDLIISSALYAMFLILCVMGWRDWRRMEQSIEEAGGDGTGA